MTAAFAELPLAVFTTLAPVGAGAFTVLAFVLGCGESDAESRVRFDRFFFAPLIVVCLGFAASMAHLADPSHMAGALAKVGSSPLSNEVCVGTLFVVLALAYCAATASGKLGEGMRAALAWFAAAAGAAFAVFTGMAYMIPTIASWSTPLNIVQMLGYALVGGSAFVAAALSASGMKAAFDAASYPLVLKIAALVGAALALVGVFGQLALVAGMLNAVQTGSDLVSAAAPAAVTGVVLLAASAAATVRFASKGSAALAGFAVLLALGGVFAARLAFYALQISVGLSL